MIAVRGCLELARSFSDDPVLARQSPDPAMACIDAAFLQVSGHPRAAIAAQAQTRLFLDRARTTLSMRCQRLAGRLRKARSPRGLTFVTWHSRSLGKAPRCSSTNLNLTAFGSRRTG